MDLARSIQPRDAGRAVRSAVGVCLVGAAILLVAAVVHAATGTGIGAVAWVVPTALAVLALGAASAPPRWRDTVVALLPSCGVVAITSVTLAAGDASAAAQVLLCVPVLYAATLLRPGGAVLTAAVTAVGDALINASLLPLALGVPNTVCVVGTVVTAAALLVRGANRAERLVSRLSAEVATDALTGLDTRRSFDEAALAALSQLPPHGVALVLFDVDAFKAVNDTYGHPVGDDALAAIAQCLRTVAGPGVVLARLGGDEFAALLPGRTALDARLAAATVAGAVRVRPLRLPGGRLVDLSVSVGTGHTLEEVSLRQLYADADADLYRAKEARHDAERSRTAAPSVGQRRHRDGAVPVEAPVAPAPADRLLAQDAFSDPATAPR